jgi:hypothetical protein
MTPVTPTRPERPRSLLKLGIPALIVIVLAAGVLGGVIGSYLPFGAKSPNVQRGHASVTVNGDGTFQADHGGVSAYLPPAVQWSDGSGTLHDGSRPSCLAAPKGSTANAEVEAGYVWVRGPEGGSYPIVTWVRCL